MIILELGLNRLCLIYFILLSGVFTYENAFSRRYWQQGNLVIDYDKSDKSITFECLIYEYLYKLYKYAFLNWGEFSYSENGTEYTPLMIAAAKYQRDTDRIQINLNCKKPEENIQIINRNFPGNAKTWLDGKDIVVDGNFINSQYFDGLHWVTSKKSYMTVKWVLPPSCKGVKSIRLKGAWWVDGEQKEVVNNVYKLNIDKPKSIIINGTSVLKSVIRDEMNVSKDTDVIIVTGAKPGEKIKVYTVSGVEVKSDVAKNDVVNIKLPNNHIYIVKAGQAAYKVALCVP